MRYFLRLAYNGAEFCGWQRQPNAIGVQQRIEEALSKVLRAETPIVGAGRTDAGVHAACMYAHFDCSSAIERNDSFLRSLNHMCGRNIAFYELIKVADDAHARFDATSRTYKYYISEEKTPFGYPYCWQLSTPLDFEAMNRAAQELIKTDDFTSFAKLHSDAKTNICDVTHAYWQREGHSRVFTITADRFLRNMVRSVVGTLTEVGRGKMSLEEFKAVIKAKDRCAAGTSVPAQGLFLYRITYPYISSSPD
ncbi:MAG: tRNA pseudouridine(38-40) synthase TruA [Prevotella sp.]|nr:tRNA pseudouridine(38-40) synthase TruA [Prevotella sp.]